MDCKTHLWTIKLLINKNSTNSRLGNYKIRNDDEFFSSSTLIRNGDYALGNDSWKKIDTNYRKGKQLTPLEGYSSNSIRSDKERPFEEEKYISSNSDWNSNDQAFGGKRSSSKKKII